MFGEVPVSVKESLAAKDASSSFRETRIAAPAGVVGESAALASATAVAAAGVEPRSSSKRAKVRMQ